MNNCESFQSQLLAYLYDVLEGDDQLKLQDHLAQCPSCQARLERARVQKRILAAAAKAEFPNVRFVQPQAEVRPASPVVSAPARRRRRPVLRWAIAAGILAVVGLPATWWL